jgi:RNA-directed DNA polymerase
VPALRIVEALDVVEHVGLGLIPRSVHLARCSLNYDKICREDILRHAYALSRSNAGAPGVDGVTFADIDLSGRDAWLAGLREELVLKTYRPNAVRRVSIPKPNGGERPLEAT